MSKTRAERDTLEVIHAAGDDAAGSWLKFPGGVPGIESLGKDERKRSSARYGWTNVRATSVDELVGNYSLGTVDVLSIDTEGNDPKVLRGAAEAFP